MAIAKTIPQRELRNDVSRILREVEAGAEFEVTVRGKPVAKLTPIETRRTFVPTREIIDALSRIKVDSRFADDVALADSPIEIEDPWEKYERRHSRHVGSDRDIEG